jgi:hypothetical protein
VSRALRGLAVLIVAVAPAVGGCGSGQEPGMTVDDGADRPSTTSQLLEPCPPGGPDETTPAAGCLGPDGGVRRP